MAFLASDVCAAARVFLNDSAASLYSNTTLIPALIAVNEELEQKLTIFGLQPQRVVTSPVLTITAGGNSITASTNPALPSDFLLPISLHERTVGQSDQSWSLMTQRDSEPENQVPTTSIGYWSYRNNGIYFIAATVNTDILLKYRRMLAVISSANSPEDFYLAKRWLAARLGEYAARYIGMNSNLADEIAIREVSPREDDLERLFVLNQQEVRARRPRFTTKRYYSR